MARATVCAPRLGEALRRLEQQFPRLGETCIEDGRLRGLVLVVSAKHGVFAEDGPLTVVRLLDLDGHGDLYTGLSVAHGDLAIAQGIAKSQKDGGPT